MAARMKAQRLQVHFGAYTPLCSYQNLTCGVVHPVAFSYDVGSPFLFNFVARGLVAILLWLHTPLL